MIPQRDSSSPSETTHGNADAAPIVAQQHFPLIGGLKGPSLLHPDAFPDCATALEALHLCLQIGHHHTQGWYADHLGIERAHFSRMLNGTAALAVDRVALAVYSGNWALLQWEARAAGFDLVPHTETELERLRRENAALKQGGSVR